MSERGGTLLLRLLVALGIASLGFYFSWWFESGRIASPALLVGLVVTASYHGFQMVGVWIVYLSARRRAPAPSPPTDLSVDVFVTACGEDFELVRRALLAAVGMRGSHTTYLLDDGRDPRLAGLARSLGAGYLTRSSREHAKAGNVNSALPRTSGDIIVVFDVDHVAEPEFLERTLGHFTDPGVGFVQVMLSYSNEWESWTARAAVEAWLDFHNPISIGMDGLGSVTMFGSNALIRRSALEAIGGYRPGLAEDLATSMALHEAGWRSAYVAEPLAPGLAPTDTRAWFTQQLKWSRGVFECLLTQGLPAFPSLTWGQRLSYLVRATHYWIGPLIFAHLAFLLAALVLGRKPIVGGLEQYLIHYLPLVFMFLLIRRTARIVWRHPSVPTSLEWRGILLANATWPVYTLAWGMALLRIPLDFQATPKLANGDRRPLWLLPQVTTFALLLMAGFHALGNGVQGQALLIFLALVQGLMHGAFLLFSRPTRPQPIDHGIAEATSPRRATH